MLKLQQLLITTRFYICTQLKLPYMESRLVQKILEANSLGYHRPRITILKKLATKSQKVNHLTYPLCLSYLLSTSGPSVTSKWKIRITRSALRLLEMMTNPPNASFSLRVSHLAWRV